MARALQCPDCGWREPLENVSALAEFRCHGCGRALKVPAQLRTAPQAEPAREPEPVSVAHTSTVAAPPDPVDESAAVAGPQPDPHPEPEPEPEATRVFARAMAGDDAPGPNGAAPALTGRAGRAGRAAAAATSAGT